MKTRIATTAQPFYYCPSCHQPLTVPIQGVSLAGMNINLQCQCKKGMISLKIPKE